MPRDRFLKPGHVHIDAPEIGATLHGLGSFGKWISEGWLHWSQSFDLGFDESSNSQYGQTHLTPVHSSSARQGPVVPSLWDENAWPQVHFPSRNLSISADVKCDMEGSPGGVGIYGLRRRDST